MSRNRFRLPLVGAVVIGLALTMTGAAFAQDPVTKGVSQATANAACAAVVDDAAPSTVNEAAFRAAANTPTGSDDVGFEGKVSPDWQALINQQEMHRDYLGMAGLDDGKTFSCNGGEAKFPQLKIAKDVQAAICASERLDQIGKPAVKDRVSTALTTLGREYADARLDCPAPPTTVPPVPPTTDPPVPPTTGPVPPAVDNDVDVDVDVDTGADNVVPNTSRGVNTGDGSTL